MQINTRLIALTAITILSISYLGCSNTGESDNNRLPTYTTVEDKVYDIPAKTQVSKRLILDDTASKEQIVSLIEELKNDIETKTYRFHTNPTNIYIYIYNPGTEIRTGGEWIAMYSKDYTQDHGIDFKDGYH